MTTRFRPKECPECRGPLPAARESSILVEVEPGVLVELAICIECFGELGERASERFRYATSKGW